MDMVGTEDIELDMVMQGHIMFLTVRFVSIIMLMMMIIITMMIMIIIIR